MGVVLNRDYEVIYAEDGVEGLAKIQENRGTLSLVLLDLLIPRMHSHNCSDGSNAIRSCRRFR